MNNKYTLEEPYVSKMRHRPFPLWACLVRLLEGSAFFLLAKDMFPYLWFKVIYIVYCLVFVFKFVSKLNAYVTDAYIFDRNGIKHDFIEEDPDEEKGYYIITDYYLKWPTMQWIKVSNVGILGLTIEFKIRFKNGKDHIEKIDAYRMPIKFKRMMKDYSGNPDLFNVPPEEDQDD